MSRTFTIATDDTLIELIQTATHRLIVVAPGLTERVAMALMDRIGPLAERSLTVILDSDPEVYRMGYGDIEALEIIRNASAAQLFELREQPGIRIGVVVSDDRTMVFSPVPRNVEAGSTSDEKPNALVVEGGSAERLADATAIAGPHTEVGQSALTHARVEKTVANVKADPPQPYDLSRTLKVFSSQVQFVELKMTNATFSTRKIRLPAKYQKLYDEELRSRVSSTLKVPLDLESKLNISIKSDTGREYFDVNDKDIRDLRKELELEFFHNWEGRGKVILRRDKDRMKSQLDRLVAITKAYHCALQWEIDQGRSEFCDRFATEFVEHWMNEPPEYDRLYDRLEGIEDKKTHYCALHREACLLFNHAVDLSDPSYSVVYKEVAIEDLRDSELMNELVEGMKESGVDDETIGKLYEVVKAVEAKK